MTVRVLTGDRVTLHPLNHATAHAIARTAAMVSDGLRTSPQTVMW